MAGRPKFVPTKEQRTGVGLMLAGGMDTARAARVIGISQPTFLKVFREEIEIGGANITQMAIGTLVREMSQGGRPGVAAACFWLKCRERWTEIQRTEVSGVDGAPIGPIKVIVEYERAGNPAKTA